MYCFDFATILTAGFPDTLSNPALAPQILAIERQADAVIVNLRIQPELPWFQGHFPAVALLPGVVQTTWAVEFARRHFELPAQFHSMSNMKFMRFIFPGALLTLQLRYRADKGELAFEYREANELCASGRMGFVQ